MFVSFNIILGSVHIRLCLFLCIFFNCILQIIFFFAVLLFSEIWVILTIFVRLSRFFILLSIFVIRKSSPHHTAFTYTYWLDHFWENLAFFLIFRAGWKYIFISCKLPYWRIICTGLKFFGYIDEHLMHTVAYSFYYLLIKKKKKKTL